MRDYKDAGTRRPSKLSLPRPPLPIRPTVLALVALLVAAAAAWLLLRPGADPVSATASEQTGSIPLTLPPPSTPTKPASADPMEPQD